LQVPYTHTQFPGLTSAHIAEGARLYADRNAMVAALGPRGGVVSEVGVAMGDFSQFLLETLNPTRFYALDMFDMHKHPIIWGRPSTELFDNLSQLDFFKRRFADEGARVEARVGASAELLDAFPDGTFDFIYIDAGHDYDNVRKDAAASARKLKQDGLLVFNDYTIIDAFSLEGYGVVQAVNELVVAGGWQVCGFALQHSMFCDIAVRRC
jgi:Methyltransferase domain